MGAALFSAHIWIALSKQGGCAEPNECTNSSVLMRLEVDVVLICNPERLLPFIDVPGANQQIT